MIYVVISSLSKWAEHKKNRNVTYLDVSSKLMPLYLIIQFVDTMLFAVTQIGWHCYCTSVT